MCYTLLQNEKTSFWAIKSRILKGGNIEIFAKGLVHGFGPKLAIFPSFYFRQYSPGKCIFTIFQNEKTPVQAIKTRSSKSRKIKMFTNRLVHFSPKPCTLPFGKISSFRFFKLKFLQTKGLVCGSGPKLAIFPTFYFRQYSSGNFVLRYFRTKKKILSRL